LKRTPEAPGVTGKDWFTLAKEGNDWKIISLIFWQDAPTRSSGGVRAPAEDPATKPKIVVSGFEQFAGRSINASSEIAQAIVKAFLQWDVTFVPVPVVWGAPKQVIASARSIRPAIWIAFGEGTNSFRIETVARNTRGHSPDNKKEMPSQEKIDPNGAEQLKLDFLPEALIKRFRNLGYDCTLSSDAGKYLCEEMLYSLLEEKNSSAAKLKQVLFIHVPAYGSMVRVREKEVPLSGDNVKIVAHDLFETIAATLKVPDRTQTR
jgi:pyroglutamyl-peptidase